ncbi:pantetheine-phosphate adenylyltransferase [Streptococcus oricebi]|uniref:Phosphopantetheine adenylyltransferase n=1 Tax=Streptococcus oricebi TaxID=1547447 RepID=A0ABS5B1X9_9STRE|nr:pantetheine-phosphate adenylyltransferase [Streptococcus oricebi]MBP2622829.1 pantetheine-phosphate adenylyltransferase [Streptococcus oricebi]
MSDKIGLFTGSFDPITLGHVDTIERASHLFDKLYVGIFYNRKKQGYFSLAERKRMVEGALAHLEGVELVTAENRLAVELARELGVQSFVRGLRNSEDLGYEANLTFFNGQLAPEIETIFLISRPAYQYISSSRIQELLAFKQDISAYVPKSVMRELERKV